MYTVIIITIIVNIINIHFNSSLLFALISLQKEIIYFICKFKCILTEKINYENKVNPDIQRRGCHNYE